MMLRRDLAEIFAEEGPRLRRFLRRFGPSVSAEDVAQDAFARLAAAEPGSITSPRAWLFQTARNLALNELKRRNVARTETVGDMSLLERPSDAPTPEDALLSSEAISQLRGILDLLTPNQREALLLFKLEGLSHREIGERLGVSHRTVERYVADATAHCFEYMSAFDRED